MTSLFDIERIKRMDPMTRLTLVRQVNYIAMALDLSYQSQTRIEIEHLIRILTTLDPQVIDGQARDWGYMASPRLKVTNYIISIKRGHNAKHFDQLNINNDQLHLLIRDDLKL